MEDKKEHEKYKKQKKMIAEKSLFTEYATIVVKRGI